MPFVKRNASGEIEAISQQESSSFNEELPHDNPQLKKFIATLGHGHEALTQSDIDFVRVVEDLVELLIDKNYIRFTDLPDKAQEKMRSRQVLRGKLKSSLNLLSEDESDGLL